MRDFLGLWSCRMERLAAALERRDRYTSEVTLLSIRSSSLMLGAIVAAEAVDRVLAHLASAHVAQHDESMRDLRHVGELTRQALEQVLADEADPA